MGWRERVEREAGIEPARPEWDQGGPPRCVSTCPHDDGKRCVLLGLRTPSLCEPVIVAMVELLDGGM